ncbi:MAG: CHAD domain-containing protein [Desulfosporosinus sp.]|nr:CHAD domain-containing protein [Desulfosporosinus sp.]
MSNNMEIELKLRLVDLKMYDQIVNDPILLALSCPSEQRTQTMEATYYDSADYGLLRDEIAYRIRQENGDYVSTVKTSNTSSGGLHMRGEWNVVLNEPKPDISPFLKESIGDRLQAAVGVSSLKPLLVTRYKRFLQYLTLEDGSKVEFAADLGEIVVGDQTEPIAEIELELKEGSVAELLKLGAMLTERYPLRLDSRSKFQRGLTLAGLSPKSKAELRTPIIHGDKNVQKELQKVLLFSLGLVLTTQSTFLEQPDDPDILHEFRVKLRTFRSLLSFGKPLFNLDVYFEEQANLHKIGDDLTALREIDVLLEEWNEITARNYDPLPNLSALHTILQEARIKAKDELLLKLNDNKTTPKLLNCWAWLIDSPWQETVVKLTFLEFMEKRLNSWLKEYRKTLKLLDFSDISAVHRFRIRCKKIRYILEGFKPIVKKDFAKVLINIKEQQTTFGSFHDTYQNLIVIRSLLTAHSSKALHYEGGIFTGYQLCKRADIMRELKESQGKLQ